MLKDSLQKLKDLIASTDEDAAKALTGNKAAAVRLRKTMMEVQWAARRVREDALHHGPTVQGVAAEQGKAVGGPGPDDPEDVFDDGHGGGKNE